MVRFNTAQFDPFLRSSIGFDRLLGELDRVATDKVNNYPPYNIVKTADEQFRLEIAVAGFSEKDLTIEVKEDTLTVTGTKPEADDHEYLHKGIGGRSFERKFTLASDLVVQSADINNGILIIELELVVPEHKKPRTIAIGEGKTLSEPELLVE